MNRSVYLAGLGIYIAWQSNGVKRSWLSSLTAMCLPRQIRSQADSQCDQATRASQGNNLIPARGTLAGNHRTLACELLSGWKARPMTRSDSRVVRSLRATRIYHGRQFHHNGIFGMDLRPLTEHSGQEILNPMCAFATFASHNSFPVNELL